VKNASLTVAHTSGSSNGAKYSNASVKLSNTKSINASETECTFNFNASADYSKVKTYSNGKKETVTGKAVKDGSITIREI